MWNDIIRNWKTSVAGLIFALGVLMKVLFPAKGEIIDKAADVLLALGPILGLLFAKDGSVSGTSANPNP